MQSLRQPAKLLGLAMLLSACLGQEPANSQASPDKSAMSDLSQLIKDHQDSLMDLADVVAVGAGVCDGEPCIRVLLSKDNAETEAQLPEQIEGIKVVAETTGPINAN